ncbi:MAG: hypothetical protein JSS81_23215 [Acidobacteria bacterium]|nr:hypothetical protein [Acidobacteriota bacterium]
MLYKPNFCCNCGEKIERAEWSATDSRRFCDVCKHDFVLQRFAPPAFAALMAIVGLFGLGSLLRGGEKTPAVANRPIAAVSSNQSRTPANQTPPAPNAAPRPNANVVPSAPRAANPPVPAPEKTAAAPDAPVYFCGAMTKKGTPCSRRVKGGGRCWQHKGQDAMLPPEKLRAT